MGMNLCAREQKSRNTIIIVRGDVPMSLQDRKRDAFGGNPALANHGDSQVPAGLTDEILLEILNAYLIDFQYEVLHLNFGLGGPPVRAHEIASSAAAMRSSAVIACSSMLAIPILTVSEMGTVV
jgi:hypothetical protein